MKEGKRSLCTQCGFVERQCICQFIETVSSPVTLVVLQDFRETKHAKNTVRLLKLSIPELTVIEVSVESDLTDILKPYLAPSTYVVFPGDRAVGLEKLEISEKETIRTLILIDATWRRAKRIWLNNAALQCLKQVCFAEPPTCLYDIRKSPDEKALSTFEAAMYAIENLTGSSTQRLVQYMVKAQTWQWRDQPMAHRQNRK